METNSNLLNFQIDAYRAVTLDPSPIGDNPEKFENMLVDTLKHLREEKARGVWLKLSLEQSSLVSVAVKHGFDFHHALDKYILLSTWLPTDQPNKLPHYATHFAGVGGIVINEETEEILVMKEKTSPIENLDFWKIPGGLVDQGEYLSQAVEREVFEETGIKAKFQAVVGFREKLAYKWEQPDVYFVCLLKPETFAINHDPREVKEAKWMKLDDYLETVGKLDAFRVYRRMISMNKIKSLDLIKDLGEKTILNMTSFTPEQFTLKLGNWESTDNVFYDSNLSKLLAQTDSSNKE